MAKDTGLGTTLTASPGGWTGDVERFTLHNETIPVVDESHLGTTGYREFRAGDLADAGEVVIRVHFEGDTALPALGTTGTLTITDPLAPGEATAASITGTAIVTGVNRNTREIDVLKTAEMTLKWDGKTGPTFTPAT